jgi:hypothetical protein
MDCLVSAVTHDDLVLAVALAAWKVERPQPTKVPGHFSATTMDGVTWPHSTSCSAVAFDLKVLGALTSGASERGKRSCSAIFVLLVARCAFMFV